MQGIRAFRRGIFDVVPQAAVELLGQLRVSYTSVAFQAHFRVRGLGLHLSVYISVYLSAYISISICLSICLHIYLCLSVYNLSISVQ